MAWKCAIDLQCILGNVQEDWTTGNQQTTPAYDNQLSSVDSENKPVWNVSVQRHVSLSIGCQAVGEKYPPFPALLFPADTNIHATLNEEFSW